MFDPKGRIDKFIEEIDSSEPLKRSIANTAKNSQLDKALKLLFIQEGDNGTPISGPLIFKKVNYYMKTLEATEEIKNDLYGFLNRIKQRHGIIERSISGEY